MILKEKKLSIVVAFILGTTMLSSVDKAWGMDDENDLIRKGLARASLDAPSNFDERSLTEDLLVRDTYVRLDKGFVQGRYNATINPKNQATPQRALNKSNLEKLLNGNFARVAASVRAASSKPKADAVLKTSLKIILDESQADPYDRLILVHLAGNNQLYSPSAEGVTYLTNYFKSLSRDKVLDFFTRNLEHVVKETPGIVKSLLAHLPKTLEEKEDEGRAIQSLVNYFIKPDFRKSLNIIEITDEMCLTNLAERFVLLRQIEESLKAQLLPARASTPDPLLVPSSSSGSRGLVKTTFRTAGANDAAEIKHSAIYASFSYQNNPGAAYSLIINHRTKDDNGSIVRVHNPNARAYINLGRLSPSVSFSNEVFDLSSLFASGPGSSSSASASIMRTELNFIEGISDIHSFKVKSDGQTLIKVTLGDVGSEKQPGVYVYAPEVSEKLQEWSEVRSEDVQQ